MSKRVLTPISERFWGKVQVTDGCWLWLAGKNQDGYGTLGAGRRGDGLVLAHRVSWELHHGAIPAGKNVLHRCDTPACVNPGHLFLGSQQENVADMDSKGRRGKTGPTPGSGAKLPLTKEEVSCLILDYATMTQQQLAAKYHIGQSTVSRILRKETAFNL